MRSSPNASERAPTTPSHTTMTKARARMASLDLAARSVLESDVYAGSVAGVVAERALDHHWEGLFKFAAARAGSSCASEWLEQLAREPTRTASDDGAAAPSTRAELYRRVRRKLRGAAAEPLLPGSASWREPTEPSLRRGLVSLRAALSPEERDVLELRYARGLEQAEVAYVLELPPTKVAALHAAGLGTAERLLGPRPPSWNRSLSGALLECFALDRRRVAVPGRRLRQAVLRQGDIVAERYEIEALLGAGAFADVYRARDRDVTGHVVALKILRAEAADEGAVKAALRELQLLASVFHPSVVQLKDHGWHRGRLWFVMPLYEGETLGQRLQRGPLSRREARQIFEPLAEALATMHKAGVLHQDIKPENVLLAELDPEAPTERRVLPVLLDLGVAAKGAELVLAGTPAYLAPEVAARFAGRPDPPMVGPKADVFSLVLTLRRALDPDVVDEVPGGTVDAFIQHRASQAPQPPRSPQLRDLRGCFERWLSFSPDRRPTAEQLRRELSELTRVNECRARRAALLRTAGPMAIAVLSLCGTAVYHFSRQATLQRTEAAHARQQVASFSDRLERQQTRSRSLEQDVARLRQQYQQSRLTRDELATRLAEVEGVLQRTEVARATSEAEIRQLDEQLSSLHEDRAQLRRERDEAQVAESGHRERASQLAERLQEERSRRDRLESQVDALRRQLRVHHAALEEKEALLRRRAAAEGPPPPFLTPKPQNARTSYAL